MQTRKNQGLFGKGLKDARNSYLTEQDSYVSGTLAKGDSYGVLYEESHVMKFYAFENSIYPTTC